MATFESSLKSTLIYVFAIADEWHKDCLKIGETTLDDDNGELQEPNSELLQKSARERIDQYTKTAGIAYQLLYTEMTLYIKNGKLCSFNDKQVHEVLSRSGIKKKVFDAVKGANEWYCCDLETVKKAIKSVKNGQSSLNPSDITKNQNPIIFRPEQTEAIEKTIKRFSKGNQMLWNAKMRFGKTLSALEVVKRKQYKRTIILTHRPVVDEGWFEDFNKIFYDKVNFHYGSRNKGKTFSELEKLAVKGDNYIYFASMQDLRGSDVVGGKFDKNTDIFTTKWDLIIVDEAHEGTQTELGKSVINELKKHEPKVLQLSGTPFNLFDDYAEDEIYTWDYVMEQRAKAEWDLTHFGDSNPYADLPAINIYTYDLGTLLEDYVEDEKAFNFREFFRTLENGAFVHDADVDRFLNLLCKEDKQSLYPYSNDEYRKIFRHTLWVLPGVKAAKALSLKLKSHPVFGNFSIVNVAGNGDEDEENDEALKIVNEAIGPNPAETYTITLSCGRLTTGVTIRPWTGVFMMSGTYSTSAAQYMQTIFRVQSPFVCNGKRKEQCYAFDFAPDRTLRVLAESAKVNSKAGKGTQQDRIILGEFLNFCPIISVDGSRMKPYDVDNMMGQLKKAQIEKVVRCGFEDKSLYNDELMKLSQIELQEFEDLKGIIGSTKANRKTGDIDVNHQGFTNEEYEEREKLEKKKKKKELTKEEQQRLNELKEKKSQRDSAISILRGISIRMPLLIYGAELNDENEEITIDNFVDLIDDQSWKEFMPKGVTKDKFRNFKKYYEADVFREAGKRIRQMAKAADKFTIEERIERIANIFNTFKNPDKETVLTPWRVVNMHMSDTLGGYCFYDDKFENMLSEPRFVKHDNVTSDVFHIDTHILEINSKTGLYPLYVAYSIYRARLDIAKSKYGEVQQSFALSLWDATIENNIMVVCKTPMAKSITKRTLVGFRNTKVNAQYYKDLIKNITENPTLVANTFKDGKHFWKINNDDNMKFDAIVGNPPYQINVGEKKDNYGILIFHKFVELSIMMQPNYLSMIFPSRWFNGGRGLDEFRNRMLNDDRIKLIRDFINPKDVFPTADIAGGINYILWDKNYHGLCDYGFSHHGSMIIESRKLNEYTFFLRRNDARTIVNKIKDRNELTIQNLISAQTPFGFVTTYRGRKDKFDNALSLYTSGGVSYVAISDVKRNHQWIDKYKVIFSKATCEHAGTPDKKGKYRVLSKSMILKPKEICSQSYLVGGAFDSNLEATNYLLYLKTRFVRYLVLQLISTQDISADKFQFVPLQDFTEKSDIDWTQPISDIDKQLYEKYNLSEEEINFIESMIKPME